MENTTSNQKNSGSGKVVLYAIIGILLASNGVLGYMLTQEKETTEQQTETIGTLESEKSDLVLELEDLMASYDTLRSDNDTLQAELEEERLRVAELLEEAKKHKDDAWRISKLKKEAASLRTIMKGYVHTIDSLNTLNIALRSEKAEVEQKLTKSERKAQNLEAEKKNLTETVRIGSRLKAVDIKAVAQRVKSNGVHRPTERANRAQKIRCDFLIDVNEIAKAGERKVYMRIIDPDGDVLCISEDTQNQFEFEGVQGLFSTMKKVDYQNQQTEVRMYWEVLDELVPGSYQLELYTDQLKIGETAFVLR